MRYLELDSRLSEADWVVTAEAIPLLVHAAERVMRFIRVGQKLNGRTDFRLNTDQYKQRGRLA